MNIIEFAEYLRCTKLKDELTNRIKLFEELCSQPATGIVIEGLLFNALKAVGIAVHWSAMSHAQDKDMIIEYNEKKLNVSLKGCKENSKRIDFSSYRTTSANTLEQKLDLIERLDSQLDVMIIFGRYGKGVLPDYYKIYLINPHYLNPKKFNWKPTVGIKGEHRGWHTEKNQWDTNIGIVEKMSSQMWFSTAKQNIIDYPEMITEVMEIKNAG